MRFLYAIILTGLVWGILSPARPGPVCAQGVKTHYKQYSIYTHENTEYLCEPYQVQKDDWLYKIFRKKGEISASDFPRFLSIFKIINPHISNIDAIEPGNHILIPLKEVDKKAYAQAQEGVVEVPVLEFSLDLEKLDLADKNLSEYIHTHKVLPGDTVSDLLGKEFLKKGGGISEAGKQAFTTFNPDIRDINLIYPGTHVLIPDPAILSEPWFDTLIARGVPTGPQDLGIKDRLRASRPVTFLSSRDLARLKRYARLIRGTLMHQGKFYFPDTKGNGPKVLDLSQTPVLEENTGQKTLVLPPGASLPDQDLMTAVKAYWKGIRLQELNKTLAGKSHGLKNHPMAQEPPSQKDLITSLVSATPFNFEAEASIPLLLNGVEMTVSLGRITHDLRPDTLVNTGRVYGQALVALEAQGYDILTLSPGQTYGETILMLFSKLGYETWKNPAFHAKGLVKTIQGIFAAKDTDKLFISLTPPTDETRTFLETEGIRLLIINQEAVP